MDEERLRGALERVAWVSSVRYVPETPSTNDVALLLGAQGAASGTVVVAERQTAGRGRQGRSWFAEPGGSLVASWIARPALHVETWTLIPLASGVAAADALRSATGLGVGLKWPNDLLVDERKIGGILVEARPPEFVVVGLGVNLSGALPEGVVATSVAAEGGSVGVAELLAAILERFGELVDQPDATLGAYRASCVTLGRAVRVSLGDANAIEGVARDVDERGALLVSTAGGESVISAGAVTHLRYV